MDMSSIIKTLGAVADIATRLVKVIKDVEGKKIAIELQGIILGLQNDLLSMQSEHYELLKKKDDLEKKLMNLKDWENTKSQYKLKEVAPGSFVYAPKPDSNLPEPNHYLCTQCFNDGYKSILQRKRSNSLSCPKCKTEIFTTPPQGYSTRSRRLVRQ